MPKIIILNVGTEHALGDRSSSSHPITRSGWRHAWFADEGDVIVSPVSIDKEFLRHLGDTLGFDAETVTVLSRDELVTDQLLLSERLIQPLRDLVSARSGPWTLMPCFETEGVAEMAERIGFTTHPGRRFAGQRGSDLLNRKSHFRQLAAGAGLPLPAGRVVRTPAALADGIARLLPETGTVIVKQDDGAGGAGNLTLTHGDARPLPGSRETRIVGGDVGKLAHDVWTELTDHLSHALVVESYHPATRQFYFEYHVDADGLPGFVDSGEIRLRPDPSPEATALTWVGLDIPAELPPYLSATAAGLAMRLATQVAQLGYRGYLNIDAITTERSELLFNEVNGRWGGGLVMHRVAERLLGPRYADRHALSSLRDIPPVPLENLVALLNRHGLRFDPDSGEGVVVLACDPMLINRTECLVLGRSRGRTRELEDRLRAIVEAG